MYKVVPLQHGAAPLGSKYRVLRSTPGDEPGVQWIFEFQRLPEDDDGDGGGSASGEVLSAEQMIHAMVGLCTLESSRPITHNL
jgi:hypothetical protein